MTKQITLDDGAMEQLVGWLTMLAQMLRAVRKHDTAEKVEATRAELQTQFYSPE